MTANQISELSKTEQFALWADKKTGELFPDWDAPMDATYIFDIEEEETPDFIEEIVKTVLESVEEG